MKQSDFVNASKKLRAKCYDVEVLGLTMGGEAGDALCKLARAIADYASEIADIEWDATEASAVPHA